MSDLTGSGAVRPRLLNPTSTAAVVLGAHDWTEAGMGRAPSFLRSARRIVAYLYDPSGLALDPELVLDLFDDTAGAGDQLARVRDTLDVLLRERREESRPVTDVLVYYVGHGHTDDEGHLSLLVRRSRRGLEAETGIKAPDLARTLRLAAPQQRRSIILDCCFSESAARAFIGMASDLNQQVAATAAKDLSDDQPALGTLLLCSSPVGQVSMGAPNAERTLFTGAILEVLQQGVKARQPYFSFADLRDAAFDRMVVSFGANAPRPVLHQVNAAQGDLTRVPAFPNRAGAGEAGRRKSGGAGAWPATESELRLPRLSDAKALISKAVEFSTLGRNEDEIAVYDDLIAQFGSASELPLREQVAVALDKKGHTLGALGCSEEAIAAYDDLIARFGNASDLPLLEHVASARSNKGDALSKLDRNEEAIAVYDDLIARFGSASALALREQVAKALYSKASTLGVNRSKEAIAVYDDLIARFGSASELPLLERVAMALLGKMATVGASGRIEDTIPIYDEMINRFGSGSGLLLMPDALATALSAKAVTLATLGRRAEEIAVWDDLITRFFGASELTLRKHVADALLVKATALSTLDRREEAFAVWDDLITRFGSASELKLRENVASALINKGQTLVYLERKEEAIAVWDDLIARFSSSSELTLRKPLALALLFKAATLQELGRSEEAIAAYGDLNTRLQRDSELRDYLAEIESGA
jgi:tetratricopeptide (TPR) repeat protein